MDANGIYEVLTKLTGKIEPIGERNADAERLENVRVFIEVFDKMHMAIDGIAYRYKDSPYASEQRIADVCIRQIDSMGIKE